MLVFKAAQKCKAEKCEVAFTFCEGQSQLWLRAGMRRSLGTCTRWEVLQKGHCVTEEP